MPTPFDVIVIGSGFGGAITARRLAEKGMRVLVLERGRRWEVDQYPRRPGDAWIFSHDHPAPLNGWMDMRFFRAHGRGAGRRRRRRIADLQQRRRGGQLRTSSPRAGLPEITYAELKPYYDTVAREMNLQVIPDGQLTQRFVLAREAARNLGYAGSLLEGAAGRQLLRGLELPARGPVQPETLPAVHQRARAAPGDVHPSRELRHRL